MFAATTRAYTSNEILAAGIDLIATSAAEPEIIGLRYKRGQNEIDGQRKYLNACGVQNRAGRKQVDALMARAGYWEETPQHPLVKLLNNPNKYTPRDQFWASLVVDYYLAGNAYILKARYADSPLEGAPGELWRLRPDRVKPVPGNMAAGEAFIKEYTYTVDQMVTRIPVEDVIHIKARNPLNPYEGMSPIASLLPRVAIDTYQRNFLSTFYERGGAGVGAMLNIKGKMSQETRDDLRDRFKRMFRAGQYDILVMSADDATYTPFGLDRGLRDALPREINDVTESRIAIVLGIPASILGLLVGMESSSYANKRQDWQVLWDITMSPLLSNFSSTINMSLRPDFANIDEVKFDLGHIRALQEDEDLLQERARKNVAARIWTLEEGRANTGVGDAVGEDHFIMPDGSLLRVDLLGQEAQATEDVQAKALNGAQIASLLTVVQEVSARTLPADTAKAILRVSFPSLDDQEIDDLIDSAASGASQPQPPSGSPTNKRGRPRLEDDASAKAIWAEAERMKARWPNLTWEQVAARVGVTDRTLREYRRRFDLVPA